MQEDYHKKMHPSTIIHQLQLLFYKRKEKLAIRAYTYNETYILTQIYEMAIKMGCFTYHLS